VLACKTMPEFEKMILLTVGNKLRIGRYLGRPWRKEQWEHVWDEYLGREIQGKLTKELVAKKGAIESGLMVGGFDKVDGDYVDWLVGQVLEKTSGMEYGSMDLTMFDEILGVPDGAA